MAAKPYMPFYFADYDADTYDLTTLEHGAYFLLIKTYWQSGKPLPANEKKLAAIVKLSEKKFQKVISRIKEFFIVNEKFWVHPRLEKELAEFQKKSDLARSAINSRWKKEGKNAPKNSYGRITDVFHSNYVRNTDVIPSDTDTEADTELEQEIPKHKNLKTEDSLVCIKRARAHIVVSELTPPESQEPDPKTQTQKNQEKENSENLNLIQSYIDILLPRFQSLHFSGFSKKASAMMAAWAKLGVLPEDVLEAIKFCEQRGDHVTSPAWYAQDAINFFEERTKLGSYRIRGSPSSQKKSKRDLRNEENRLKIEKFLKEESEDAKR